MATSGKGEKPFEVAPSARFLGDGVYVWFDMEGRLVIQRQPQYAEDSNFWRLLLTPADIATLKTMTQ